MDPEKISPCWHLLVGFSTIATLIWSHLDPIPLHIRRKSNHIVDDLANIRFSLEGPDLLCMASTHTEHPIL
jgi:hypothetical protein